MSRLKRVLLVEDDQVDAMTVKRAFQNIGFSEKIIHMNDGEVALGYLKSDSNVRPDLILLDLNMPRMNGFEFLHEIKRDNLLSTIPVIVLTTSEDRKDVTTTFSESVAGYMTKPVGFDGFEQMIRSIENYWAINRLPGEAWEGC